MQIEAKVRSQRPSARCQGTRGRMSDPRARSADRWPVAGQIAEVCRAVTSVDRSVELFGSDLMSAERQTQWDTPTHVFGRQP
jgi:hypothetical protein